LPFTISVGQSIVLNPISFVENSNFVGNLDEDNGNFDTSGILYEILHIQLF